jgi:hypothetical protein
MSGVDPKYQLRLDIDGPSMREMGFQVFPIIVPLPERFTMGLDSQWSLPFGDSSYGDMLNGKTVGARSAVGKRPGSAGVTLNGGMIDKVLQASGVGTKNLYQFMQVWDSTSPLSFSFDFIFNAKTNAAEDVKHKHLALLKLAAPSSFPEGSGILSAPGPSIPSGWMNEVSNGESTSSRQMTLYIGDYLVIDNVIVKSVSSDVQCLMGEEGIPMAMSISVTFETFVSGCTTQMLDRIFKVG